MARSAKGHQDEFEDDEDEELLTANTSSSLNKVKVDEPSSGKRVNPHRSKHSETEQRRRSKINERFQVLRDLIPQNDQKRDKASFLLEVIEYIQFLQEKIQIYEQSYEGWNQEPTKLIPWRNHHGPAENTTDPSQAIQNGSVNEKNNDVCSSLPKNIQNAIESDFSATTIQKSHTPGSATEAVPLTMQMRLDMFDPVVSSGMATQHLQEPVSNIDMPSHTQPQVWLNKPNKGNYILPHNNTLKEEEELAIENGSDSISSAYSQGILDNLTQALQSSGVDMSQTSVSVQFDVGRRTNTELTPTAYGAKDHENHFVNNRAIAGSGVDYCNEDSEQCPKRLRQEAS
ncbi:transcription factor BIM2 [Abrus precatorius]|uniref:Transcription factor BIM2 n=1 Tax=Abrus precatorius TaxID=3816 RepID=A0A8B8L7V6_ABRPR|nr:transcription factor BIM2 [Abrus precatorius]